jgi:uncharacterized protein YecE (DUF72 family)
MDRMHGMQGMIRIGTAGWNLPKRDQGEFPADGSHLARYAQRFPIVEIDTSFYRHHRHETYQRWAESTPATFSFAVKLPRILTHGGSLSHGDGSETDRFVQEVSGLGAKLGVLLTQLPPKLVFDATAVRVFFGMLAERVAPAVMLACEARHETWGSPEADQLLGQLQVARVAVDPTRWNGDMTPGGNQRVAYFRWHGAPRIYYSNYEAGSLARFSAAARSAAERGSDVWCVFDNTASGCATGNALEFQSSVR